MISVEDIPDEDSLYYRVHINLLKTLGGKLGPNCFRDPGGGMSSDWSKYSSPEQARARSGNDKAANYGVTGLQVGRVRQIEGLRIEHAPIDGNDAHAHVLGLGKDELLTQQRAELYDAGERRCAGGGDGVQLWRDAFDGAFSAFGDQ